MQSYKKWNIKKIFKEIAFFALILFVTANIMSYLRSPTLQNDSLPTIESVLLDGTFFKSENVKGKPFILYMWATWCPACKVEASNIQTISKEYEVLTVAVKSGDNKVLKEYMEQNAYDFKVINDSQGEWAEKLNVVGYPTIFIFDKEGKLKFTDVGYTTMLVLKTKLALLK